MKSPASLREVELQFIKPVANNLDEFLSKQPEIEILKLGSCCLVNFLQCDSGNFTTLAELELENVLTQKNLNFLFRNLKVLKKLSIRLGSLQTKLDNLTMLGELNELTLDYDEVELSSAKSSSVTTLKLRGTVLDRNKLSSEIRRRPRNIAEPQKAQAEICGRPYTKLSL